MKTTCEVKTAISGLIAGHIARESNSPFIEAKTNDGSLVVGVRDQEGATRRFNISVEEITEAPTLSTPQSQPQDEAGKAAQANDGCCHGTQTCGEATQASPAQEDATAECNETANQDADAKEATPAS